MNVKCLPPARLSSWSSASDAILRGCETFERVTLAGLRPVEIGLEAYGWQDSLLPGWVSDHLKMPRQGSDLLPKPCPLCHLCRPHLLNAEPNQIHPTEIFRREEPLQGPGLWEAEALAPLPTSVVSIPTVALCSKRWGFDSTAPMLVVPTQTSVSFFVFSRHFYFLTSLLSFSQDFSPLWDRNLSVHQDQTGIELTEMACLSSECWVA